MITMQELRPGVSFILNGHPFLTLKSEFVKSGRNAAVMKLKIRNLINNQIAEGSYKAADKVEEIVLDLRPMRLSYKEPGNFVFMDDETFELVSVSIDDLGHLTHYIINDMRIEIGFYKGRAVDVRVPLSIECEITEADPGIRGDTTGRSFKRAKIQTGYELMVPLFCEKGTKIRIDTRTGEYIERVK